MAKRTKGILGKPNFTYGETVSFELEMESGNKILCTGTVAVVDSYGTFFQNEEPSYDVMVENFAGSGTQMFVKHIRESNLNV